MGRWGADMTGEEPNWGGQCPWGLQNWGSGPVTVNVYFKNDTPDLMVSSPAPVLSVNGGDTPSAYAR
jgi:hypothetical protein